MRSQLCMNVSTRLYDVRRVVFRLLPNAPLHRQLLDPAKENKSLTLSLSPNCPDEKVG